MDSRICSAISGRQVLTVEYGGGLRVIEPHCHGVSRAGNEVVRAWQVEGHSRRGEPAGWKLFTVPKVVSLVASGGAFPDNRPGYNPADRHMVSVHCHV